MQYYIRSIRESAPDLDESDALEAIQPWQAKVQDKIQSGLTHRQAAQETQATYQQEQVLLALYAAHVAQIARLASTIYHASSQGRTLTHELQDLLSESYLLWRQVIATYDPHRASLSTYVHEAMRRLLQNVLRDGEQQRECRLDDELPEGQLEPTDHVPSTPIPTDWDVDVLVDTMIEEHAARTDRPAQEHARLQRVWHRLTEQTSSQSS
jgi:DNA-directed RNA polymerase specialized sigma24 family protein